MGTTNEKIGAASQCSAETRNLRDLNRRQQTPSPTMMMKTALKSAILCACLSALALGASGEAHGDHSGDDKMMMEGAMNDTMMGNMTMNGTMGNMTEMANDTIAAVGEMMPEGEMPVESSDDGRRSLFEAHGDHSEGEDHSHSDDGEGMMMDANMTMNGTEANMTMNATEMANDTIAEGEMPVESSDDGRRRLLQLGDAISGAVDNAKETAKEVVDKANEVVNKVNETIQGAAGKVNDFVAGVQGNMTMNGTEGNMTMNGTEMANDTIDGAGEMMPEEGEMPVESSDDGRRKLRMVLA